MSTTKSDCCGDTYHKVGGPSLHTSRQCCVMISKIEILSINPATILSVCTESQLDSLSLNTPCYCRMHKFKNCIVILLSLKASWSNRSKKVIVFFTKSCGQALDLSLNHVLRTTQNYLFFTLPLSNVTYHKLIIIAEIVASPRVTISIVVFAGLNWTSFHLYSYICIQLTN